MQTLDEHLLFSSLSEMNIIERKLKDAIDKLTDGEMRDFSEKKQLRSLMEEAMLSVIQNAEDKISTLAYKMNQLVELRASDLSDEMKVKAFHLIIDEYKRDSLWQKVT